MKSTPKSSDGEKSIHLLSHEETVCNSATVIPSATFQKM